MSRPGSAPHRLVDGTDAERRAPARISSLGTAYGDDIDKSRPWAPARRTTARVSNARTTALRRCYRLGHSRAVNGRERLEVAIAPRSGDGIGFSTIHSHLANAQGLENVWLAVIVAPMALDRGPSCAPVKPRPTIADKNARLAALEDAQRSSPFDRKSRGDEVPGPAARA